MTGRIIQTDVCVAEGAAWLAGIEPRFAAALTGLGPLPLRLRPDGFAELLRAIICQQVSVASAAAIWARITGAGMHDPDKVYLAADDDLRALGLSRPKVRYAKALAQADLPYDDLREMTDDDVIRILTAVPGIGVWTAEVYAMFALGRADIFAPGDLALQESARILFQLPKRPTEKDFRTMACAWSPWRSVAARLLWAYYAQTKQREGMT